jgi:UDP:flavonoid glycosyltransferase YjiC (YdhE family)
VKTFGYLPFSDVLPHAAMLVYHGGIGTLAQTIKAGIPHLVVPNGHDQFDNAWRIEQLGLGRSIPQTRYRANRVVEAIRALLADGDRRVRCLNYASRMDSEAALTRACALIRAGTYFVTCVVIGWSFGYTKVATSLVVTLPLFIPSCTLPGSTENVSPVL